MKTNNLTSGLTKPQLKKIAKVFKVQLATLSFCNEAQLTQALRRGHHGFGTSVRNELRMMGSKSNAIELDGSWSDVIRDCLALKLYDPKLARESEVRQLTA